MKKKTDEKIMGVVLAAGKGTRMRSELPKVLHEVNGQSMVQHVIGTLRGAGVEDVTVVVGYKAELVEELLGDDCSYAVQREQLGTGHAVAAAREQIETHGGLVLVAYGDMPLLSTTTVRRLIEEVQDKGADCSFVTITLDNPPAAGRIIRDDDKSFIRVVEQQDCDAEQLKVKEINVGTYCFRAGPLLDALVKLRSDNSQGEYYLTDVPELIGAAGSKVVTVEALDLMETLGVNDREHLRVAESQQDISFAESLYDLLDAVLEQEGSIDTLRSLERR